MPSGGENAEAEKLRLLGNEAFGRGDWKSAVEAYTQSLAVREDDKRVYSNRSAARLRMAGQLGANESVQEKEELLHGALEDAETVVRIDPTWSKGYYRQGLVLESMGRSEEAVACLLQGLNRNPDDAEQLLSVSPALRSLVEAHANETLAGKEGAESKLRGEKEVLGEGEKLRLEGNAAFKSHHWDQAIRSYTEAVNYMRQEGLKVDKRIFSNRSAAYLAKANETESKLTYNYAIEDAEECVMIDPHWAKSWYRLGLALADSGRGEEGIIKLEQGLMMCPDDADLQQALKTVQKQVHQPSKGSGGGSRSVFNGGRRAGGDDLESNGGDHAEAPRSGNVVDTSLYDILDVKPNATAAEIKRGYLLMAKETHPDKNKEDPEATEKFQKIGMAYQVLSHGETRDAYDKLGMKALENVDYENVDPSELFAMMFGSDRFDKYLGELQLTSMISQLDGDGNPPSDEALKKIQADRLDKLTENLIALLERYVNGEHRAFGEWARAEALELREANFGGPMLYVVGQTYVRHANIALGKHSLFGLPGFWRQMNNSRHKFGTKWSATASAIRMVTQQKQMETERKNAEKEGKTLTEEQQATLVVNAAIGYLDVIWKQTVMDIVYTLDEVCHRVLEGKDLQSSQGSQKPSVASASGGFDWKLPLLNRGSVFDLRPEGPKEGQKAAEKADILLARADALKVLGKIFMESGTQELDHDLAKAFGTSANTAGGGAGDDTRHEA